MNVFVVRNNSLQLKLFKLSVLISEKFIVTCAPVQVNNFDTILLLMLIELRNYTLIEQSLNNHIRIIEK